MALMKNSFQIKQKIDDVSIVKEPPVHIRKDITKAVLPFETMIMKTWSECVPMLLAICISVNFRKTLLNIPSYESLPGLAKAYSMLRMQLRGNIVL